MIDKYEIPDEPVDINGEWMKIATAQATTIERLADALESVLTYADTVDEGLTTPEEYKPMIDARALLAEIRGAK